MYIFSFSPPVCCRGVVGRGVVLLLRAGSNLFVGFDFCAWAVMCMPGVQAACVDRLSLNKAEPEWLPCVFVRMTLAIG